MAHYRKIQCRIWNDEKFMDLSKDAKLIFFFLLTHPNMTAVGGLRTSIPGLAAEIDFPLEGFREALGEVFRKGMAKHDEKASLLWLPNFLKYNKPESPNVVKAWVSSLDFLPECGLKVELIQHLKGLAEGLPEGFHKAFLEAFRESSLIREQRAESRDISPLPPQAGAERGSLRAVGGRKGNPRSQGTNPRAQRVSPPAFEAFVQAYPTHRRNGRNAALDVWLSLLLDDSQEQAIIASIEPWSQSEEWKRDNGRYVPGIDKYLRDRKWEDVPTLPEPEEYVLGVRVCPNCDNVHHLTKEPCPPKRQEMTQEELARSRQEVAAIRDRLVGRKTAVEGAR